MIIGLAKRTMVLIMRLKMITWQILREVVT